MSGYAPPQQQAGHPPQPSYPPPAHAAMPPQPLPQHGAAPRSSSSKVWIPIVGGVAAIGIIIAVVVATRGGGSDGDKLAAKGDDKSDKPDKSDKSDTPDKDDKPGDKGDKAGDKGDKAGGTPDKPASRVDLGATMLAKMTSFRDRACACKDKPCADTLQAEVATWTNDQAKNPPKAGEVDDPTMKKMADLASAYIKCSQAAAGILAVGDRVTARWPNNGRWYPGRVAAIRADGTYDINYDDGDRSSGLPASSVHKQVASSSSSSSSSSSQGSSRRPDPNAPCPGPGLTRRCNGVCVNIQENSNHCGGCNNRCSSGKSCDGHMSCRDAAGNL